MSDSRSVFGLATVAPLFAFGIFVTACASGCAHAPSGSSANEARAAGDPQAASAQAPRSGGATVATTAAAPPRWRTDVNPADRPAVAAKTTTLPKDEDDRAFPVDDVRTAMKAAADGLRSCGDAEAHSLQAALHIEASGKVSKVDVSPAAGPVAGCVRARLSELAVPAFSGESVTVLMPVQLEAL